MSASILIVAYDIGNDIATNVGSISWAGSSAGGMFEGNERPLGTGGVPSDAAVFIREIARAPIRRANRGGSATGQMHKVTLRLVAVAANGRYDTTHALIAAAVGYAHGSKPTNYTDVRLDFGPINQPPRESDHYARTIADLVVEYSED